MTDFEVEVRALLGRASGPLKRNEVYEELSKIGVVVGGKEPLNTVASRLSRMQGVINLKGFGYWPEERPYPPAGHPRQFNSSQGLFNEPDAGSNERASVTMDAGTSAGDE